MPFYYVIFFLRLFPCMYFLVCNSVVCVGTQHVCACMFRFSLSFLCSLSSLFTHTFHMHTSVHSVRVMTWLCPCLYPWHLEQRLTKRKLHARLSDEWVKIWPHSILTITSWSAYSTRLLSSCFAASKTEACTPQVARPGISQTKTWTPIFLFYFPFILSSGDLLY